jgi:esterase/lipase
MIYYVDMRKGHPVKFDADLAHLRRKWIKAMQNQYRALRRECESVQITGMILIP